MIKEDEMGGAHRACMREVRNTYRIFIGKVEERKT
jgi:hypothetical protein